MNLPRFGNRAQREAVFATLFSSATGMCAYIAIYGTGRWQIVGCGIFVAGALFLWRMKYRFIYGLGEIAFGLFVLWYAAGQGRGSFSGDFGKDFDTFQFSVVVVQTVGAIYILVRGLDNVFMGLPAAVRDQCEKLVKNWHL